jgi:hypothetical protein
VKKLDLLTALVVVVLLALQVRFCLVDQRAPTDLGHYYNPFRNTLLWWDAKGEINWPQVDTPYTLLLALLGKVFTPSVAMMEWIDGGWLVVLLVGTALAGRALAGPLGGTVAVLAIGSYPQTLALTRTHWIHHPEAAALAGALGVWATAPGLSGWGQAFLLALLLFFGETIRQTGAPFGILLGLVILAAGWRSGARVRLIPTLVAVIGAIAWWAPRLAIYLQHKAESASEYAKSVGSPWPLVAENLGAGTLLWALPFAVLGLVLAVRRWDASSAAAALAAAWIAGGLAAVGIYNVGPDNFPMSAVGLAVLAGIGARAVPWAAVSLAPALASLVLTQVQPLLLPSATDFLPKIFRNGEAPGPINYQRVYWNPISVEDVLPAVSKVCAPVETTPLTRCFILATRGLFNPSWEDGGTFALFLSGKPRATVVTPELLWDNSGRASGVTQRVHALVDVECAPGFAPSTGGRFQVQYSKASELFSRYAGDPIGTYGDPDACVQTWYAAPNGGARVQ